MVLAGVLLFWGLGRMPLEDYDEATYADVARNVINRVAEPPYAFFRLVDDAAGVRVVRPWFEKPPLLLWLMAGSMVVGNMAEWSVRLPSAFFGWLVVLVTLVFGYRVSGRWQVGALAAGVLMLTQPFIAFSREGRLDSAVMFFVVLCMWSIWEWRQSRRSGWLLLFWASIAFGFLSKHVIGLLPLGLIPLSLLLFDRRALLTLLHPKRHVLGLLVATALLLPWHLLMWRTYGDAFLQYYFFGTTVARAGTNVIGGSDKAWGYYAAYLWEQARPAVVLLGCAVLTVLGWAVLQGKAMLKRIWRSGATAFYLLPAVCMFVFFSLAQTKLAAYLLPAYPFAALGLSVALVAVYRSTDRLPGAWTHRLRVSIVVLLCLWVAWAGYDTVVAGWKIQRHTPWQVTENVNDAYEDERAVGEVLRQHPEPAYIYRWSNLESITYYAGRTVQFLPREEDIQVPIGSLLILPQTYVQSSGFGEQDIVYQGKVLAVVWVR